MKWFRMYSEVLHDPKVQRLTPAMFKHWVNLLCLANDSTPRGVLPSTDDIAFALRIKPTEAARIVADLVKLQLLELTPDGRAIPHNWTERQRNSDDVAARVARHRAKDTPQSPPPQGTNHKATNGYVTLHEPLPVTLHTPQSNVLDRDIEMNRSDKSIDTTSSMQTPTDEGASAPEIVDNFTPWAKACWDAYPARNGKKLHKAEFVRALKAAPLSQQDRILGAIVNYAASSQAVRGYAEDPHRFMRHWQDWEQPETPTQKGSLTHDHHTYSDPDAIAAEIARLTADQDVSGHGAEPVPFRRRA